jgi:hypothetical protein
VAIVNNRSGGHLTTTPHRFGQRFRSSGSTSDPGGSGQSITDLQQLRNQVQQLGGRNNLQAL